ncbi:MAG: Asp-tRNA(Asn)/Glu-tRNA(Gln) amidotransferase subunit GatA [Candidatus Nanosyncoccaceae bacterium]|jgi:aspartyl-tRNA(Asn)/glutamyl-tRNA(Gln) amidotransferase subunit A
MLIQEIAAKVEAGELKAVDLVKEALIKAEESTNYNVFLHLTKKRALARATEIDERVASGKKNGALAGVPFAIKDNILAFDGPTTASSKMLGNFYAPLQATVIEKLEAAGAICIGKTNLDAFAHGSSTENSDFGSSKNAINPEYTSGGSSGGSASAVALGVVPFALGTDTGGSVRQPASFNGVVGVKPSYGLVSRFGVVAMSSSFDTIGCLTNNVADADLVLSVIAGQDRRDVSTNNSRYEINAKSLIKPKIAAVKQFMSEGVDEAVLTRTKEVVGKLSNAGYEVSEVDIPELKYALAVYHIITSAEVSSNLSRHDGVRYGYSSPDARNVDQVFKLSRSQGFNLENKRRIMVGNFILSSGNYEAYYLKAQKVRTLLIESLKKVFTRYDFLIGAVVPTPAFKIGTHVDDPLTMYMQDLLTTPANLTGAPAISLPNGVIADNLPIGLQIMADVGKDVELMAFAKQIEPILEDR